MRDLKVSGYWSVAGGRCSTIRVTLQAFPPGLESSGSALAGLDLVEALECLDPGFS